ncbi:MAG: type II toxin-antitoxin system antitoxin, RelB/DinJ family [Clostridium sp.]|nr:type II toxin-antitoxin system antitoxin, RelB/DinJ family [Clostridium sp.]
MATTNINERVDTELKSAVSHDGIPFEVKRIPNAVTRAAIAEYEEMRKNPGSYKRYASFDELMDEVLADD